MTTDPTEEDGYAPGFANRLWRVEQRQNDVLRRLEKFEQKLLDVAERQDQRQWRMDALEARVGTIEARIAALEKHTGTPMFGDYQPMVKFVVYVAAAMIVAIATGQALNITGLFK